ncbi:MAG: hypothetical protein IAE82_00115 [Opitutaceae bacterium]|nr:hypothetical protein [Opitutaceae bacterium]
MTAPATLPRVAVLGYGSQGRAHALNLRDSGVDVVVGLRLDGPSAARACADGFDVRPLAEAVANAGLLAVLTPDMVQAQLYREVIASPDTCASTATVSPSRRCSALALAAWSLCTDGRSGFQI